MFNYCALVAGLAVATLAGSLRAAERTGDKYTLAMNLSPGSSWSFERNTLLQGASQSSMNGQLMQQRQEGMALRLSGTITVLEASKGLPTVLRVTFGRDCHFSKQASDSPGQSPMLPIAGQTLLVRRFGDAVVHNASAVLPPEVLSELRLLTGHDPTAYPPRPVAVGEEWAVPAEQVAKVLGTNPQSDRATLKGKLLEIQESGGRKNARIHLSGDVQRRLPDLSVLTGQMTADLAIDLASGRVLSQELGYQDRSVLQSGGGLGVVNQTSLQMGGRATITDEPKALAAAAKRPEPVPPRQGTVRFCRAVIRDTALGMDALSLMVPSGWTCDGKVAWRTHPTEPALVSATVANPKGIGAGADISQNELHRWRAGDFQGDVRQSLAGSGGQPRTAVCGRQVVYGQRNSLCGADPVQFLQQLLFPRQRPELAGARVVEVTDSPWAAAILGQRYSQERKSDLHTARVRLEYSTDGKQLEEDFLLALSFTPLVEQQVLWQTELACSLRAEKGKLDPAADLFQTMLCSPRVDLKWYSRERQAAANTVAAINRSLQAAGKMSQTAHESNEQISEGIRASYEQRQAVVDRTTADFCRAIRSVEVYSNPFERRPVELPSGYNHVWTNPRGEYVLTDNPNLNPNVGDNLQWKRLEAARQ